MIYKKLGEVSNIMNGFAFKSKKYVENGIRIIRIANVQDGYISDESPCFYPINSMEEISQYSLRENDLLISLTGNVGRVGILTEDLLPAALNQRVCCIRSNQRILNTRYLFYYLRRKQFVDDCTRASKGVAQLNLSTKWLTSYLIPLPSLETQQQIVSHIEELFSDLDDGVATLEKTKKKLELYRQTILAAAFNGKLTDKWRSKNEKTNEFKICGITDLVKQEKNALKAGPFGSSLKKESYSKSGYKIYGQEQVIAGDETIGDYYIDKEKYHELESCKIAPHDVLISLVGTVGKVLVLSDNCKPGIINPRLIKVSLDEKKMLPGYFKYYFESGYLRSLYKEKAHGATMDVLNMRMIKELPFPVCKVDEQRQIISDIEERFSVCDEISASIDTALQQAASLRQSILKKAFEGELVHE